MANTIQIKRSLLSAAPTSLAEGELAYVFGTDTLYIGAPGSTMIVVAGASTYAKLASPAFTGTPTAPTATGGTNTTQVATTAFVQAAVGAAGGGDMLKSVYDPNDDGKVSSAVDADAVPWAGVTGKPSTFTPSTHSHATSDVTGLDAALLAKAALASPALTGMPTAPTAAASTNTTQLATTAFVRAEITALVNGAAGTLDTLNELAAAIGNDANYAATVSTALGIRLITTNNLSDLTNATTARTNLGLGTMATQAASAVNITGGTINGVTLSGGTF